MANNTSQHILSTSANLLGFCLFILTSLHIADKREGTLIDEFTSVIALLLTISSFFSFVSIRTTNLKREAQLERIADYFFIISLVGILMVITVITFNYTQRKVIL
jgi:hypothetical protein